MSATIAPADAAAKTSQAFLLVSFIASDGRPINSLTVMRPGSLGSPPEPARSLRPAPHPRGVYAPSAECVDSLSCASLRCVEGQNCAGFIPTAAIFLVKTLALLPTNRKLKRKNRLFSL